MSTVALGRDTHTGDGESEWAKLDGENFPNSGTPTEGVTYYFATVDWVQSVSLQFWLQARKKKGRNTMKNNINETLSKLTEAEYTELMDMLHPKADTEANE